jgi:galactokinase/mevalonate kinase-like predicted kinase
VLNVAVGLNGAYPISATVRRIREGVVRCISFAGGAETTAEYRTVGDVLATASAGSPFLLPATALQLIGVARRGKSMVEKLSAMGGGIETRTLVRLPIGSGLGVSSILAAVLLCALAALAGVSLPQSALVSLVLLMEQMMGTGGGWQDQAGAIYPGAKLLTSGPGLQQRLRADIIPLTDARRNDFTDRLVLYYTGIHRKSRTLGARIVGKYLARDRVTLRVLDSIRTLAAEMAHAMKEGEWDCLGRQMDRHWQLNRILDPGTSDAPIEALLSDLAPYLAGAKLAGAGGGGFLLLLARGAEEASFLRNRLVSTSCLRNGALYGFYVSEEGLRVTKE